MKETLNEFIYRRDKNMNILYEYAKSLNIL